MRTEIAETSEPTANPASSSDEEDSSLLSKKEIFETGARSTNTQAFFSIFNSFIGSGILALPYSFHLVGGGLSILCIIFLGILTYYCLSLLFSVADNRKRTLRVSFEGLAESVMGPKGKSFVQVSLLVMQLGSCIGSFIFANKFLNHVFCTYDFQDLCNNKVASSVLCAFIIIPISFITNVHFFHIPSLFANLFMLLGYGTQIYYGVELLQEKSNVVNGFLDQLSTFNFMQLPLLFGVAIYAYQGIGALFNIRSAMSEPKAVTKLLKIEIGFLMTLYSLFPLLNVVALDGRLQEIVLFSLPTTNPIYLTVQVLYATAMAIGVPLQLFPVFDIIEHSGLLKDYLFTETGRKKNAIIRYPLKIITIAIMIIVANGAKSFYLFLNFMGSFIFIYVGYLLPIWMYNVYYKDTIKPSKLVVNVVSFGLATTLGVIGVALSLKEWINYEES